MRAGNWLCLVVLLLSPAAAAEDRTEPTLLFNALWQRRMLLNRHNFRLLVVELKDPAGAAKGKGMAKIQLRILADLGEEGPKARPEDITLQVRLSATHKLSPHARSRYYVALMRRYTTGNRPSWAAMQIYHLSEKDAQGRSRYSYYYMLPVDRPDGLLARAIRELLLDTGRQDPGRRFKRMLAYVAGKDTPARDLASSFAAVNGWGFTGADPQNDQPDAFARALLAVEDATTRRRMARAYSAAKADLLPRDRELLERLFGHQDEQLLAPALRDNLRHAAARSGELADMILAGLAGTANDARLRPLLLRALTGWEDKALRFRAALEAIARGKATPAPERKDRLVALRILVDADDGQASELVRHTLVELPSAVGLEYAVEMDMCPLAPAVLGALHRRKLVWSEAHAAALSLLTRRFPGGPLEQFQQWWSRIQQAGRAEAMLESAFADPQEQARAHRLLEQLGSRSYKQRRAAREELAKLGMAVLPVLQAATAHADPDVAVAATSLIATAEAKFKGCRERLAAAAKNERNGTAFLPWPEDVPATRPAETAPAKGA